MRFDRQIVAGLFASLIAFLALPAFLPGFTIIGGFFVTQIIVWGLAWVLVNLTYFGGGNRGRK